MPPTTARFGAKGLGRAGTTIRLDTLFRVTGRHGIPHLFISTSNIISWEKMKRPVTITLKEANELLRKKGKKNQKYRNKPVKTDEGYFASTKEYHRWLELKALQKAGEIRGLMKQIRIPLQVKGVTIGHYIADFLYTTTTQGATHWIGCKTDGSEPEWGFADSTIIEDAKGFKTDIYKRSKRHMKAQYGIDILET
jgi:hypothetical protein